MTDDALDPDETYQVHVLMRGDLLAAIDEVAADLTGGNRSAGIRLVLRWGLRGWGGHAGQPLGEHARGITGQEGPPATDSPPSS